MGSSRYSDDEYSRRDADRKSTGTSAFAYDDTMRRTRAEDRRVNQKTNPFGVTRESRDSAAHPESLAIMMAIDVTGSMATTPMIFQRNLPKLMGLLLQKRYNDHPQVLFAAVGDATCDQVPLQVGQFESGLEMEDDLGRFYLEGGGGGQTTESYEHAIYFAARHTSIDCFEKRQKKGYLFLLGDENPYPAVKKSEIKKLIGDKLDENIPIERIVAEAMEKYEVFYIIPAGTSHWTDPVIEKRWTSLLGKERFIRLENPEAVSELIAVVIGFMEGKTTLEKAKKDVRDMGGDERVVDAARQVLLLRVDSKSSKSKKDSKTKKKAGKDKATNSEDTKDDSWRL